MNAFKRTAGNVSAIAVNSFREGMRDRILYVIVVFAVAVIALGKVIGWVSVGEDLKVVRDIGLTAMSFFGVLVAVFVGANLIHREIERHTITLYWPDRSVAGSSL